MTVNLGLDDVRPAVMTIDLHRGHLDPEVATMPLPDDISAAVLGANLALLGRAREAGIPAVHLVTSYRDESEIVSNPFWRSIADTSATRANNRRHNLEGGPGVALMPGVYQDGDAVLTTKKRYDCFLATDLEFVLRRSLDVNTLLIGGVNTNSCVLTTTTAASVRDFACIVVEECVDTMDGPDFHEAALKLIDRAFGWVMTIDEALAAVAPRTARAGAAPAAAG